MTVDLGETSINSSAPTMNRSRELRYQPQLQTVGGPLRLELRFYPVCWFCFLVLNPIYIFRSGLPQPSDYLMAFLLLLLATGYIVRVPIYRQLYLIAALLLGYVAIVNWFWWAFYSDNLLFLSSIYYAFNFGVFLVVISMFHKFGMDMVAMTRLGLAVAITLELVVCLLAPSGAWREIGTFNNPNQLSYWGLLSLACWLVLKRDERLTGGDLVIICMILYALALGLSKAALIACAVLVLLAIIMQGLRPRIRWTLVTLVALAMMFLSAQPALLHGVIAEGPITNVIERLSDIGEQQDDTAAHRGYDRFWLYPQYLILGAGEGAFQRFPKSEALAEIHSTFGAILFSYGIVGFTLFALLLYQVFRKAPIRHLAYFAPICIYGLTHQGLRFTLFWVFLALVFGLSNTSVIAKKSSRHQYR